MADFERAVERARSAARRNPDVLSLQNGLDYAVADEPHLHQARVLIVLLKHGVVSNGVKRRVQQDVRSSQGQRKHGRRRRHRGAFKGTG